MVGSLYKLLVKVFMGRLFKVMDKLISFNHSTFLKDRLLVKGVVVVNELVDLTKKRKKSCFNFKVEFKNAFMDYMLSRFGFSGKWKG